MVGARVEIDLTRSKKDLGVVGVKVEVGERVLGARVEMDEEAVNSIKVIPVQREQNHHWAAVVIWRKKDHGVSPALMLAMICRILNLQ